jgi:hypothetical protein
MADDRTSELDRWRTAGSSHTHTGGEARKRHADCVRTLIDRSSSDRRHDVLRHADQSRTLATASTCNPGWFFGVNCHRRYVEAEAPDRPRTAGGGHA